MNLRGHAQSTFHRAGFYLAGLCLAAPVLAGCTDRSGGGVPIMCRDPLLGDADADAGAARAEDAGAADAGAPMCRRSQPVFVCDVANARDLGGTPAGNGQSVACGAIYRGAPLAGLSPDGCEVFARLGIKTVIDLRVASETAALPESACVQSGATIVSAPMPIPYNVSGPEYIADLDAKPSLAAAFAALGNPAAYPIYIHCTWGRDRTGVLAAAILSALGATRADILQEYALSQRSVGAFPASLIAMLDEIDARGGIEAVLTAAGVTPEQLAALRARVLMFPG